MKKMTYIIIMVLIITGLVACQDSEGDQVYTPNVPDYSLQPSGDTLL